MSDTVAPASVFETCQQREHRYEGGENRGVWECLRTQKFNDIINLERADTVPRGRASGEEEGPVSAAESLAHPRDTSEFLGANSITREIKKGKGKESGEMVVVTGISKVELWLTSAGTRIPA